MDMSRFVDNWEVGTFPSRRNGTSPITGWASATSEAVLNCPSGKPVTMEIQISGAEPPSRGKILIAQGTSESEELWAIRMIPSGRLVLQLGTAGHRETSEAYFPMAALALSYNPANGVISLCVGVPGSGDEGELLVGHALNQWVRYVRQHDKPPRETWQLCLGCPQDGRADQPPLGWTISAGFRFGESLGFSDSEELRRLAAQRQADLTRQYCDCIGVLASGGVGKISISTYRARRDRIYNLAAEGADHQELSAEWHLGVLAGARAMGWKGGAA